MREIEWIGRAYDDLVAFPNDARQEAGYQLHLVHQPVHNVGISWFVSVCG